MQSAVAYLKGGERYVFRATRTAKLIKVEFADGFVARVPLREIPGLPGPVTSLSIPGPTSVFVHCGRRRVELPWDWLRGFGDVPFAAKARSRGRESLLSVGRHIAAKRHERGWSQQSLADKSGVDRSTVARAEIGEQMPSYATLVALSKAFACSLAELLLDDQD